MTAPPADPADPNARWLNGRMWHLRPGGVEPRLGCGLVSHEVLGWCFSCPGVDHAAEAWRLHAAGNDVPDVEWARAVSRARWPAR